MKLSPKARLPKVKLSLFFGAAKTALALKLERFFGKVCVKSSQNRISLSNVSLKAI